MSLLDQAMTDCNMYRQTLTPDGYGGYKTVWAEDTESTFKAALVFDNSSPGREVPLYRDHTEGQNIDVS